MRLRPRDVLIATACLGLAAVLLYALIASGGSQERAASADGRSGHSPDPQSADQPPTEARTMTITVVYDNNPGVEGLQTAWGFGCVVELPTTTILFDTGGDGSVLLGNMSKLGIEPAAVDLVALSHIHGDHVGGLPAFLAENAEVTVFVPPSFPQQFKDAVRAIAADVVEATPGQQLAEHVYTTGEMGAGIREQTLVLETEPGLVVITGCAHPGVVEMVAEAKRLRGGEVELVLGGFHLGGQSRARLESIARAFQEMGVRRAGPCHCSGDEARAVFAEVYGDNYEPIAVGSHLELPVPAAE